MVSFDRIKAGDKNAFNLLFRSFYPSMCSVAYSYVKDEDMSRDIAQEVFINLWTNKDKYDTIDSLRTFLYVSVKNKCLNYFRDSRERCVSEEDLIKEIGAAFSNAVIEEEAVRIIYQAIDTLAPRSREIMKMTIKGIKNAEISQRLGISVNTVKTLKYNALKSLKLILEDYYYLLLLLIWLNR